MVTTYNSFAQTPNIITYQGKLTHQGTDVSGERTITARLYANAEGTQKVWEGTYKTYVTDGIFALPLGAGKYPLPAPTKLDKQLWVGITVDGIELRPLTQLTSSPYALNVADKSITKAKLADELIGTIGKQDQQTDPNGTSNWHEDGNHSISNTGSEYLGTKDATYLLIKVGADSSSTGGYGRVMWYNPNGTSANILGGHNSNTIGNGFGNVISGGGYYLHSNKLGSNASTSYAYLGGGEDNILDGWAAVLVGGENDTVVGNNSFLGGGKNNSVGNPSDGSHESVILGGSGNRTLGDNSSILGGRNLSLSGDNAVGFSGGSAVMFTGSNAMFLNDIDLRISNNSNSAMRLIFHKPSNNATGNITTFKAQTQTADIDYILPDAQGSANTFLKNDGSGTLSWVDPLASGVNAWNLTGNSSTTPPTNFLGTIDTASFEIHVNNSGSATQGRKRVMRYEPNDVSPNIIGGFNGNSITPGKVGSVIAGGGASGSINQIIKDFGFIGGGLNNSVKDSLGVIVGGSRNTISDLSRFSFIGGGDSNTITSSSNSSIVGGLKNKVTGLMGFVGGGEENIADGGGGFGVVVGGRRNKALGGGSFVGGGGAGFKGDSIKGNNASGSFSVVVGGRQNHASGTNSFIGGGDSNTTTQANSVIGGGFRNKMTTSHSFIGGGRANQAIVNQGATHLTIPGGDSLIAQSYAQTVIGAFNIDQGASSDRNFRGQVQGFTSTDSSRIGHTNDRLFIIGNGIHIDSTFMVADSIGSLDSSSTTVTVRTVRSNAFEVDNKGVGYVYGSLNSRGPEAPTFVDPANPSRRGNPPPSNTIADPAIYGGIYQDNLIIAHADVPGGSGGIPVLITPNSSFGVDSILFSGTNMYTITLHNAPSSTDPNQNTGINQASIVATLTTSFGLTDPGCGQIVVSRISNNQFNVFTFAGGSCAKEPLPFMFHVVGRRQ